jgi:predicted TIM-barrel fold metal-dependent hydrolase
MHAACNFIRAVYSCLMSLARAANLLGAIALSLADDILETAERHVAHGARRLSQSAVSKQLSRSSEAQQVFSSAVLGRFPIALELL